MINTTQKLLREKKELLILVELCEQLINEDAASRDALIAQHEFSALAARLEAIERRLNGIK